jgi:hypothetical protein
MSAGSRAAASTPEFRTAKEMLEEERRAASSSKSLAVPDDSGIVAPTSLVAAECGIDRARAIWNDYLRFRELILDDPACYDEIAGHKELNRTGATRLALPFGLSIEERLVEEGRVELADSSEWDYRFRVRVRVAKGARFVDGIGSCRLSEVPEKTRLGDSIPISQREHFALTKAWTRAMKRAIADILGGTAAEG